MPGITISHRKTTTADASFSMQYYPITIELSGDDAACSDLARKIFKRYEKDEPEPALKAMVETASRKVPQDMPANMDWLTPIAVIPVKVSSMDPEFPPMSTGTFSDSPEKSYDPLKVKIFARSVDALRAPLQELEKEFAAKEYSIDPSLKMLTSDLSELNLASVPTY